MHLQRQRWTGSGVEVVSGARSQHPSNLEKITFKFYAVCDAVDPEVWHGEVRFGSHLLITTPTVDNEDAAGRLAEKALEDRVVALFASS